MQNGVELKDWQVSFQKTSAKDTISNKTEYSPLPDQEIRKNTVCFLAAERSALRPTGFYGSGHVFPLLSDKSYRHSGAAIFL